MACQCLNVIPSAARNPHQTGAERGLRTRPVVYLMGILRFASLAQDDVEEAQPCTGNWQLATGNWQLATGNRQPASRHWQLATGNPFRYSGNA